MTTDIPPLTIGDIARECGVKLHIARYAVGEYDIEPRQRAGIIRLAEPFEAWHSPIV